MNSITSGSSSSTSSSSHARASSSLSSIPSSCVEQHPLRKFVQHMDYSWIDQLSEEDLITDPNENNKKRPVKNGHFVLVTPRPLKNPRLVAYSKTLTDELGLEESEIKSKAFADFFSGNVEAAFQECLDRNDDNDVEMFKTWATPYALSIMGQRYTSNCPFGTGEGYGDGRAISIAEIDLATTTHHNGEDDGGNTAHGTTHQRRLEFQLKGGGPTPFCRGADGRAVLRSSIREFLASEAMHFLGIDTTRALSLIVSDGPNGDTSARPWYDNSSKPTLPSIDDPRLALYPLAQRKQIIAQLARQKRDPDMMIMEPNAITCRVSPSFVRVGHIDLFSRRVQKTPPPYDTSTKEWKELEEIVRHACFRDVPAFDTTTMDIQDCASQLLDASANGIVTLVANWLRVGFCQGNFNADNCLVAGRTMDYGPFGFMDQYDPLFAKWTGSGEHFGFLNQPRAAFVNYIVLVESVLPLLLVQEDADKKNDSDGDTSLSDKLDDLKATYITKVETIIQQKFDDMWKSKMGFDPNSPATLNFDPNILWEQLEVLMRESQADWTLTWRQLYHVCKAYPIQTNSSNYEEMLDVLLSGNQYGITSPFYQPLTAETRQQWMEWIESWRTALYTVYEKQHQGTTTSTSTYSTPEEIMRLANPKYVLREWMLVDAYTKSAQGDDSVVQELLTLIEHPYDEGTEEEHEKYYRRAPEEALTSGGTAFMS